MKVRRVVTGHDSAGKSVFVSDTEVEPVTAALLPGSEFHKLWGGDPRAPVPRRRCASGAADLLPARVGFRFGEASSPAAVPRRRTAPATPPRRRASSSRNCPGLAGYMEPDAPGMHTTDTIEPSKWCSTARVWLELDGGEEVHLRAGDTVVQNGTRHAWHNKGTAPARLAVFIVGAHHAKFPKR